MATITLSPLFDQLNNWPGRLLEAQGDEVFLSRTATTFSWRYGASSEFAGYTVTATGTGFSYLSNDPVAGLMTGLVIRNAAGQTLVTFSGLSGFTGDLSQFAANVFGGGDEGPGPNGGIAWSHLMSSNDVINGTSGDDGQILAGTDAENDTYNMGAGDDQVSGGLGNDSYFGGDGHDHFTLRETQWNEGMTAIRGATINVQTGIVLDPWGGTDTISGFERFTGSRFNDRFIGSDTERDEFSGLRGNDTIDGGAVTFIGGVQTDDRRDIVNYDSDYWGGGKFGVVIDLETSIVNGSILGTARDGFGNRDTLIDIERAYGTSFGDQIIGSSVNNVLGGAEGRDTLDGAGGWDVAQFSRHTLGVEPSGVKVNLALAVNQVINDGFGNVETLTSIEELWGSDNADILRGNASDNGLAGQRGADTLSGQGGQDTFIFYEQGESNVADRITDFAALGIGADSLGFGFNEWTNMTSTLQLVNGTNATSTFGTFLFINATDQLIWDANGTGAGGRTVIAVITNVTALTSANFELWD